MDMYVYIATVVKVYIIIICRIVSGKHNNNRKNIIYINPPKFYFYVLIISLKINW